MDLPLQPFLLSLPSLIYLVVQKIRKQEWAIIFTRLGWRLPDPKYLAAGLGLGIASGLISFLIPTLLPADVLDQPGIAQSVYSDWTLTIPAFLLAFLREAFYVALGEEVFFRGFVGRWLYRRFGFTIGNLIQSLIFLLPHLILLTVSLRLWPLLIAQLIGGWLFGWLCHQSESILPGWLAHALSNTFGAVIFMS